MKPSTDERPTVPELPELIDRWVADGVISPAQAARMRADAGLTEIAPTTATPVPATPAHPAAVPPMAVAGAAGVAGERTSVVAEALAYLGGVIVLVATGLIGARYWDSLAQASQLGVVGGAAAILGLAGFAVPSARGGPGMRLRSVLWLLATAGAGGFFALFADRVLDLDGAAIGLVAGSGAAVLAALLWWRLPILPQQAMFFVATMVAASTAVAQLTDRPHLPGLAVWATGAVWFALGWRGTVKPRRPVLALAAVAALVGALMTLPVDAGIVLALGTLAAVVVVAVVVRDLLLLAVGAVGALNILPTVVNEWFPGELAAPLVLLGVGALLVATAVYVATVKGKS
jgi:hypothetical protein